MRKIKIDIPDLPTQRSIANNLKSIDKKIELNRKMNQTLEEIGQALFRHYFITNPNANKWKEKSLADIADFLNGAAMQKYPPEKDTPTLPVIKIREMSNGITDNTDLATINIPGKYLIETGDLLFSWSGTLVLKFWDGVDGALNQHLFKVTSEEYPEWLYYFWTKHHLASFIATAKEKATTMGHITRSHLVAAKVRVPEDNQMMEMSEKFSPILEHQKSITAEIQNLTQLRDSLLPRLIDGRIEL